MRFRLARVQKVALVAFLMGGVAVFIGQVGSLAAITGSGAILIAVAPAVIGFQAIAKRRITAPINRYGEFEEVYKGFGAATLGLLLVLSTIALAAYGTLKLAGIGGAGERALDRWPGLAAAGIGLGLTLYGIAQASSADHGEKRRISILPERIGGAMTALLGISLVSGGLLHTVAPALFDSLE